MNFRRPSILLAAFALVLAACGGDGLEAASEQLREMQQQVEEARARVETRETEARAADAALASAREQLAEAGERLAEARERVEKHANDAVLFRQVQQRLLDADDLTGVAISARVQKRVVTLEGSVPREELKARAEKVATGTPGVETVVNQIQVRPPGE